MRCSCGKEINVPTIKDVSISFEFAKLRVWFDCECGSTLCRPLAEFEQLLKEQNPECFIVRKAIVEHK